MSLFMRTGLMGIISIIAKSECDGGRTNTSCKTKSAATKSMRIAKAPPVLTLHLKRFGYSMTYPSRMTKVNNMIEYPTILDVAPYMTEDASDGTRYRLFAVTNHHGSSLHYGHYTSYVRGADGTWYSADDEDVRPVQPKDVMHDRSAYLLSYVRVGANERNTPVSTPVAAANGSAKRMRDESPSPAQRRPSPPARTIGPVLPPSLSVSPAKPAPVANGTAAVMDSMMRAYESDSGSESLPIKRGQPPVRGRGKGKHHRLDHKAGAVGRKSHGHGKRGAPMPFVHGHKKNTNMRAGRKGMIGRMKGRQ